LLTTQLTINGQYLTWLDNGGNTSYPLLALEETKVAGLTFNWKFNNHFLRLIGYLRYQENTIKTKFKSVKIDQTTKAPYHFFTTLIEVR
jgi:hypothetical protein